MDSSFFLCLYHGKIVENNEFYEGACFMENTTFDILHLFGEDQINAIQDRLSRVTQLGFVTVDYRGESLTDHTHFCDFCHHFRQDPVLSQNCNVSDAMSSIQSAITGKPLIYQCPCGLMEIAIPIVIKGSYLGGFLCGQALCENPPEDILKMKPASDPKQFEEALATYGQLRQELPSFPYEQFMDIADLVSMIVTMLCENKIQQLEQESDMKAQLSRMNFLQTETVHLAKLYYQADYQALMHYVPSMTEQLYGICNHDETDLPEALKYLMNNFLQTALYDESDAIAIFQQHPLPIGSLLKQPMAACWIMQILDQAMQRLAEKQYPILGDVFQYINENLEGPVSLNELTQNCNVSQPYLSKLFRQCFQVSVSDYIHSRKILASKMALAMPGIRLTDIAFRYGYSDYSHFSKVFKKYEGISPSAYRSSMEN